MEKVIIVGGGVSGLSCLNALLDQGYSPLLLEAATIGTPKMCGEFLAPEAVTLLRHWKLEDIQEIKQAAFYLGKQKLSLSFPQPAGAIARSAVELQLADYAKKRGGRIRENALLQKTLPPIAAEPYRFHLASGEVLEAETVIFASGKYGQATTSPPPLPYFGIKIHFPTVLEKNTLLMYSSRGAYYGIVPISATRSNLTCLVTREEMQHYGSCQEYLAELLKNNPALAERIEIEDYLAGKAPEFQQKINPAWPRAFWIGDALATLYPAIGSGFAHSIHSAVVAATYYQKNAPRTYQKLLQKTLRPKLKIGKLIHRLLLNPRLGLIFLPALKMFPGLTKLFLNKLGYQPRY